jgi:cell surface protein SprA
MKKSTIWILGVVWVNEMRLSDFVSEGGSAAIAQAQIQGADFFNISASASYYGINWGAVDSRVQMYSKR